MGGIMKNLFHVLGPKMVFKEIEVRVLVEVVV